MASGRNRLENIVVCGISRMSSMFKSSRNCAAIFSSTGLSSASQSYDRPCLTIFNTSLADIREISHSKQSSC